MQNLEKRIAARESANNTEPQLVWLEDGESKAAALFRAGIATDAKVTLYSWLSDNEGGCMSNIHTSPE